jgi:hypothetical protein
MSVYQTILTPLQSTGVTIIGKIYTTYFDAIWSMYKKYDASKSEVHRSFRMLSHDEFMKYINELLYPTYTLSVMKHRIHGAESRRVNVTREASSEESSSEESSSEESSNMSNSEEDSSENEVEASNVVNMLALLCPFYHPCFGFNAVSAGLYGSYTDDTTLSIARIEKLRNHPISSMTVILQTLGERDTREWYNTSVCDPDWLPSMESRPWIISAGTKEICISSYAKNGDITVDDILFASSTLTSDIGNNYTYFTVVTSTKSKMILHVQFD